MIRLIGTKSLNRFCSGGRFRRYTDTQQERLLYNQYEYGRYQKSGKSIGRVEDGYVFVFDGVGCYFILTGGGVAGAFHFNVAFMASDTLVLAVSNAL